MVTTYKPHDHFSDWVDQPVTVFGLSDSDVMFTCSSDYSDVGEVNIGVDWYVMYTYTGNGSTVTESVDGTDGEVSLLIS